MVLESFLFFSGMWRKEKFENRILYTIYIVQQGNTLFLKLDICKVVIAIILYFAFLSEKKKKFRTEIIILALYGALPLRTVALYLNLFHQKGVWLLWDGGLKNPQVYCTRRGGGNPELFSWCNLCKEFTKTLSRSSIHLKHHWSPSGDKVHLKPVKQRFKKWSAVTLGNHFSFRR